jgi:iron complex transport system ATP-binding protein
MNTPAVSVCGVSASYGRKTILRDLSVDIPEGSVTSIMGRNGCGKSTLLRVITANMKAGQGTVFIEGKPLSDYGEGELARTVAFLPQVHDIPRDMTSEELVACGRYPYQHWWKRITEEDKAAVDSAMSRTYTESLRHRMVSALSGGERQRIWIAMALAQKPRILILDEPTTYLDICHQMEVMELLTQLNREENLTVLMVLHDINQACRYSSHMAVMEEGRITHFGSPAEVINPDTVRAVFHVNSVTEIRNRALYVYINSLEESFRGR